LVEAVPSCAILVVRDISELLQNFKSLEWAGLSSREKKLKQLPGNDLLNKTRALKPSKCSLKMGYTPWILK
jgi:hypothetical protein